METSQLFFYISSWCAVITAIYKLFDYLASISSQPFTASVTNWITTIRWGQSQTSSKEIIYNLFLKFFGDKHFSFKCLFRCFLYSAILCIVILLLTYFFNPSGFDEILGRTSDDDVLDFSDINKYLDVFAFVLLMIQDYISLFKTRLILKKIKNSKINILTAIFIDLILTVVIAEAIVILLLLGCFLVIYPFLSDESAGIGFEELLISILTFWGKENVLVPFFITIFLGAFWILLIELAAILAKISTVIFKSFDWMRNIINVQEKPIQSLGAMLIFVITIIYLVVLPFVFIK